MTITVVTNVGGINANNETAVSISFGTVSVGNLIVVAGGKKYNTVNDQFVAGDCTKSAGTSTIGTVALDVVNGGDWGGAFGSNAIWSAIATGAGTLTMEIGGNASDSYLQISGLVIGGNWDATRTEATNSAAVSSGASAAGSGNASSVGAAIFVGDFTASNYDVVTITPDGSFTAIYEDEASNATFGSIYRIVTGATTDAADWTIGTAHNGGHACVAVYKEVAGAPRQMMHLSKLMGV